MKAPTWSDLQLDAGDRAEWTYHLKPVEALDLDKVAALPILDPSGELRARFEKVRRVVEDPSFYTEVPPPYRLDVARVPHDVVEKMVTLGHAEPHPTTEPVRSRVRIFPADEPAKHRMRVIKHPPDVNDSIPEYLRMEFSSASRLDEWAQRGSTLGLLDWSAFYDQIPLTSSVRPYFCFVSNGKVYRLKRAATGQRHVVELACTITDMILAFDHGPVDTVPHIDNVGFCGETSEVRRNVLETVARCRFANVTVNDIPKDMSDDEIVRNTLVPEGDFLGRHYSVGSDPKTVALTQKTLDKINAVWKLRSSWTWRQFAGLMGLLFYAQSVQINNIALYFGALKQFRVASTELEASRAHWDEPATIWPSTWRDLEMWVKQVTTNKPRELWSGNCRDADHVIITDASDWGVGIIHIDPRTGSVQTESVAWEEGTREDYRKISTRSETEGIYLGMCRFVHPTRPTRVAIISDGLVSVSTANKRYAKAFEVNQILSKIQRSFPLAQIVAFHIKGSENPSDNPSRGVEEVDLEKLQRVMGDRLYGSEPS